MGGKENRRIGKRKNRRGLEDDWERRGGKGRIERKIDQRKSMYKI